MTIKQGKFKWLPEGSIKQSCLGKGQEEDKMGPEEHSKKCENENIYRLLKAKTTTANISVHPIFLINLK